MKNRDGGDYEGKKWDVYVYGDVNIDLVVPGVSSLPKPGQEDEVPVMDTYVGGGAAAGLRSALESSVCIRYFRERSGTIATGS